MNLIKDHPFTASTVCRPLPRGTKSVPSVLLAGVLTDSLVKGLTEATDILPTEEQSIRCVSSQQKTSR